jgi:glutathione S-transferase
MVKELGIPYEHVPVIQHYRLPNAAAKGLLNTQSPAFLAVNPNGLVPTIDDDGFVMNESLAITLYLARKHGGPVAPQDVREEGLMTMWSQWAATECEMPALRVMQNAPAIKTRDSALLQSATT